MNTSLSLVLIAALLACLVAAASDVRTRRIPNAVPVAMALVGLGYAAGQGVLAVAVVVALMLGTLLLGTFAFAAGWLGGGDVKLLAAVTGSLGLSDALPFLLYTSICGGLIAVCFAIARRRVPSVLRSVTGVLRPLAFEGTVGIAPERPIKMPYALAIAAGAIAVALSHSIAPFLRLPL